MRRFLLPALVLTASAALAACGPAGPATPGASAGASAMPSGAPGSAAPGTSGSSTPTAGGSAAPVALDLAKFPLGPTTKRRVVYAWTAVTTRSTVTGTDEAFEIGKCDSSCTAYVTRIADGKTELQRDTQTLSLREGVLIPTVKVFKEQTVDLEAKLKEGGTWPEETITVKAGTFKTQKVTYGGTRSYTYWIQKPYIIKAEYKNTDESTTAELQSVE